MLIPGPVDLLAPLRSSPVAITGATTLTATAWGKLHVCSGTSTDYAVTLPSPVGRSGHFLAFAMDPALTKLVSLTPSGSEKIGGATGARVTWANESVLLRTNGTDWFRIGGVLIPHSARIEATAAQSLTNGAFTELTLDSIVYDVGSLTGATNKITIRRTSNYLINVGGTISSNTNPNTSLKPGIHSIFKGGSEWKRVFRGPPDSYGYAGGTNSIKAVCTAGDVLRMASYIENGTSPTTEYLSGTSVCGLSVMEIISW